MNGKDKKKVKVFAESREIPKYEMNSSQLPPELRDISREYTKTFSKYQDIHSKARKISKNVSPKADAWAYIIKNDISNVDSAIEGLGLKSESAPEDQATRNSIKELFNLKKKKSSLNKEINKVEKKFRQHPKNEIEREDTFIQEANKLKQFYKDSSDVDFEVIPFYGEKEKLQQGLKELGPKDKAIIMGHSGKKMGGIPNEEIAQYIKESDVKDCYFGSCNFTGHAQNYKGLDDKTIYYRPESSWYGVYPGGETFEDAMWGKTYDPEEDRVKITKPKEGVSYQKFQKGGDLKDKTHIPFVDRIVNYKKYPAKENDGKNFKIEEPNVELILEDKGGDTIGKSSYENFLPAMSVAGTNAKLEKGGAFPKLQNGGYLNPAYMEGFTIPDKLEKLKGFDLPKGTNIPSGAIGTASSFGSMALDKLGAQRDQTSTANMAMDAGSGALSGLSAGAAFGPIGMGVGALAGGAMGLISANKEKEAAEDLEKRKEKIKNMKEFQNKVSSRETVDYTPVFQKGGKMNKEMLEKFEGPKHTDGGIDLNIAEVEGGETEFKMEDYVFSDDINYPGTKMTFAEKSKKIENKYPGNDRFAKEAKERELKNLMEEQEEINGKESEDNKMQEGGFLSGENKFTDAMSLLPTAATAGLTVWDIFSDPAEPDLPRMEGQAYTPQLISKDPYLREVEETFGEQERAITRGARTPGQYMAGRIQSATEETKAKSDVMRKIDQMNREERARAEQMGFEQDRINLMQEAEEERLRLQSLGAKRNAIRRGISSLGTQAGQIARDIRARKSQEEYRNRLLDYINPYGDRGSETNRSSTPSPRYEQSVNTLWEDSINFDDNYIDFRDNKPIDRMFMYDEYDINEIQI